MLCCSGKTKWHCLLGKKPSETFNSARCSQILGEETMTCIAPLKAHRACHTLRPTLQRQGLSVWRWAGSMLARVLCISRGELSRGSLISRYSGYCCGSPTGSRRIGLWRCFHCLNSAIYLKALFIYLYVTCRGLETRACRTD